MLIQRDRDVRTFLKAAEPLLYAAEAEYSLILGLTEGLAAATIQPDIPPILLRLEEKRKTVAVFMQLRESSSAVSALSEPMARKLARYLVDETDIPVQQSFVGSRPSCSWLAEAYAAAKKLRLKVRMAQKILSAETVTAPRPAPGKMRLATRADFARAFDFIHAFHRECIPHDPFDRVRMERWMMERLEQSMVHFWEVDGRVVSSAHASRPTRHGQTINAVYTPGEERGRGYASNLMAALTEKLLNSGKRFCVLYTDASNPTSNKIYESVGYRVVCQSEHVGLTRKNL